ncbi:hypothetical protein TNCV_1212011 [Trichonephila clavipes]|nr:hypothetical protein TNCV_1212011 [Trichonephila clavipes]
MAFGGSLPQINLGVQGVTQGGHHMWMTEGFGELLPHPCKRSCSRQHPDLQTIGNITLQERSATVLSFPLEDDSFYEFSL